MILFHSADEERTEENNFVPSLPVDLEHIPFKFNRLSTNEMLKNSQDYYNLMNKRRTVRMFSTEDVPIEIIRNIIKTGGKVAEFR